MTTPSTPHEPWDDDRLNAAFAARASMARATAGRMPTDLTARTLDAVISDRGRASLGWRRFVPAMAMLALVALVVALAASMTVIGGHPTHDGAMSPGTSMSSPTTARPEETSVVLGLPITTVADAIAVRDAGIDDREIAIRGWYTPFYPLRACGRFTDKNPLSPLQMGCPDLFLWLMQNPERLSTVTSTGMSWRGPAGPAISPDLDDIDMSWTGRYEPPRLVELVVIGHFDDRRSFACPADEIEACRDRFVVDRVVSADGRPVPTSALDESDGGATSTAADVEAKLHEAVPGAEILSMAAVDGATGLERVEPSIGVFAQFQDQRAIWVVGLLDRAGQFGSYLVVDGTDAIYKIDEDSVATLVAGAHPLRSAAPWPPDGATVVELLIGVGSGRPPVRVAVVDETQRLVDARAATASERAVRDLSMRAVWADDLPDDRVLVQWGGSMCDDRLTLTISAFDALTPFTLTVDGRRASECRAALVYYAVVLEFEPAIGAVELGGRYLIGP